MINALIEIGFKEIGCWQLDNDSILVSLSDLSTASPALYAFVVGDAVKYIGKTSRSLGKRLYGYAKGSGTQRTNIRVRALIIEELKQGGEVKVFGFQDQEKEYVGKFLLDRSAGLEDDIIRCLNPEWNDRGVSRNSKKLVKGFERQKDKKSTITMKETTHVSVSQFLCRIGKTYYQQGFFNVPVDYSHLFGKHNELLKILLPGSYRSISAKINRTVNINHTPRVMGGVGLRDWFQKSMSLGDWVKVDIVHPDVIKISPTDLQSIKCDD